LRRKKGTEKKAKKRNVRNHMTQGGKTFCKEIPTKKLPLLETILNAMEKPTLRQLVLPVSPDRRPPDTHTTSKGVTVVNLTPKSPVPGKAHDRFRGASTKLSPRYTPAAARFAAFI